MTAHPSASSEPQERTSVARAIIIGQVIIQVPEILLIFGPPVVSILGAGRYWRFPASWLCIVAGLSMLVGCAVGWLWWSFAVPRWRRWALRQGVPADELQKWAVMTALVWPKGWIFEKTEFKVKD